MTRNSAVDRQLYVTHSQAAAGCAHSPPFERRFIPTKLRYVQEIPKHLMGIDYAAVEYLIQSPANIGRIDDGRGRAASRFTSGAANLRLGANAKLCQSRDRFDSPTGGI